MRLSNFYLVLLITSTILSGCSSDTGSNAGTEQGSYEPTWTSLRRHSTPQWLIDAKFGIYTHWGLSTVSYLDRKEGKRMTLEERIENFNPHKFDPDAWSKLFHDAGARFAGPVAWHGSNYLHWDSKYSDFNSVDMNPGINIVAELEKAYRKMGMKFVITYHYGSDTTWLKLAKEGVDLFSPDLFWVDANFGGTKEGHHIKILNNSKYIGQNEKYPTFLQEKYQLDFLSYYYNHAEKQGKEVDFIYKSYDIPPGVGIRDLENGLLNEIAYDTWMTDMDMHAPPDFATHGWFYDENVPLRTGNDIIDILVDVVSKNGILLLNVPPMVDGSFSYKVREYLLEVGAWLKVNGEAIYGASPWFIFGEGPSTAPAHRWSMHHNNHFGQVEFTSEDIRFTVNGTDLYATCLDWPGEHLMIKALESGYWVKEGEISSVTLLGYDGDLAWEHTPEGLKIRMPERENTGKHAFVFKIKRH